MKNLLKNAAVFIVLSVALSAMFGCSTMTGSQSGASANSAKTNEFPPAPSGIMQADIKDVDGNSFKLADKKGKVLLVNLWATWCGPCRSEMPDFIAMQDKYKDRDFEIIGLDSDAGESPETVKAFAKTMKLNYLLGYADTKLFGEFMKVTRQSGIPQTILIDRDGKMTGIFFGSSPANIVNMKAAIEKVINQ